MIEHRGITLRDIVRVFGPTVKAWERSVFTFGRWRRINLAAVMAPEPEQLDQAAWNKLSKQEQREIERFCEAT